MSHLHDILCCCCTCWLSLRTSLPPSFCLVLSTPSPPPLPLHTVSCSSTAKVPLQPPLRSGALSAEVTLLQRHCAECGWVVVCSVEGGMWGEHAAIIQLCADTLSALLRTACASMYIHTYVCICMICVDCRTHLVSLLVLVIPPPHDVVQDRGLRSHLLTNPSVWFQPG